MRNWECTFRVNSARTVQVVAANSFFEAKKLIEAQYTGSKISWITVKEIRK